MSRSHTRTPSPSPSASPRVLISTPRLWPPSRISIGSSTARQSSPGPASLPRTLTMDHPTAAAPRGPLIMESTLMIAPQPVGITTVFEEGYLLREAYLYILASGVKNQTRPAIARRAMEPVERPKPWPSVFPGDRASAELLAEPPDAERDQDEREGEQGHHV